MCKAPVRFLFKTNLFSDIYLQICDLVIMPLECVRIELNIYEQHRKYVFHLFPGVRLIDTFLKDTDILSTLDTSNKQKVYLIKVKVFNERKR